MSELCHSDTAARLGLNNQPNGPRALNLERLACALESVSRLLGHALTITSGYRSEEVNAAVGGVPDSQHIEGLAADFKCMAFGSAAEVASTIANSDLVFDQLIVEYGRWVHLSIAAEGQTPRREVLHIPDAATGYLAGLPVSDEAARS